MLLCAETGTVPVGNPAHSCLAGRGRKAPWPLSKHRCVLPVARGHAAPVPRTGPSANSFRL